MAARLKATLLMVLICLALAAPRVVYAHLPGEEPKPPERVVGVPVAYTRHEWWLVGAKTGAILCRVYNDRPTYPTGSDIRASCGEQVYAYWRSAEEPFLFQHLREEPAERIEVVQIDKASVWLSLPGCKSTSPASFSCPVLPMLTFTGEEPYPAAKISAIHIFQGDSETICKRETCRIALTQTGEQGVLFEFWADSTFRDTSDVYRLLWRALPEGRDASGRVTSWKVDLLSTQLRDSVPGCALSWETFPPAAGLPNWLQTPDSPEKLASSVTYTYLASRLIASKMVDASTCPAFGLAPTGMPNICGLEKSRTAVAAWQNRFDRSILDAARKTGVPAQLIKNVFARESQFWPGRYSDWNEAGLGQLTDYGADTTLRWNPLFYAEFCPWELSREDCALGYDNLKETDRATLRRALMRSVNAICDDCEEGFDPVHAEYSIQVFAQALLANCNQADAVVKEIAGKRPNQVSSYTDMWRLTLLGYNGGVGCLIRAVGKASEAGESLTFENVAKHLDQTCGQSIQYVKDISQ
ncbi:MAG TPA: hypothetical protein VIO61_05925 [Anaerolineaceae bacterium]